MELTFCQLRTKEVVNMCDGKRLGNIIDLVFDSCTSRILGFVVPQERNFFAIFKSYNEIFIPYDKICKIGKDIILVDLSQISTLSTNSPNPTSTITTQSVNNNKKANHTSAIDTDFIINDK